MKNQLEPCNKFSGVPDYKRSHLLTNILRLLALLLFVGVTIYIYRVHIHIQDFTVYGYSGIFLVALLANATLCVPAPGVAVVFLMGSILPASADKS